MRKYASKQVLSIKFHWWKFVIEQNNQKNNFILFYLFRTFIWMDGSNKFRFSRRTTTETGTKVPWKCGGGKWSKLFSFFWVKLVVFRRQKKVLFKKIKTKHSIKMINSWKRTGNRNEKENFVEKQMKRLFYYSVLGTHSHSIKCMQN